MPPIYLTASAFATHREAAQRAAVIETVQLSQGALVVSVEASCRYATNGQAERMNRTTEEVTVKRFYSESHNQFQLHLTKFTTA